MEEEFVKFYSGLSAAKRSLTRKMLKEEGIGFDSFSISKHPPGLAEVGLSFSQQRLSFPDRLDPRGPSYHIPTAVRLLGALDIDALTRTFNEIVRRHEAPRTSVSEVDGMPVEREAVLTEEGFL